MNDIEKRIQTRDYVSPGRARMAVNRSRLSAGLKKRLLERVTAWEDEQSPVVGGEPPAASPTPPPNGHAPPPAAGEGFSAAESDARTEPETVIVPKRPEPVATLNLNAWVRVRFTLAGLTKLHAARERVVIPGDIVSRQGEWSGTLWELMLILASDGKLGLGDQPVASNLIEVLDTRTTPESESFEPDFSVSVRVRKGAIVHGHAG